MDWMPRVKIRLQWQSGRAGGNVAWGYFKLYLLPTVGRNEMTGAEIVDLYIWLGDGHLIKDNKVITITDLKNKLFIFVSVLFFIIELEVFHIKKQPNLM